MRHRPVYRRIMDSIRGRIRAGDLAPGARVDSERRLALLHGVSLMTARHALAQLEADGVVVRRPGSGTYVAEPRRPTTLTDCAGLLASRGEPVEIRVLALVEEAGATTLERLISVRDSLAATESITVRAKLLSAEAAWSEGSLEALIRRGFDLVPDWIEETIEAVAADLTPATRLGIPEGTPLVRVRQTSGLADRITLLRSDLCPLVRSLT